MKKRSAQFWVGFFTAAITFVSLMVLARPYYQQGRHGYQCPQEKNHSTDTTNNIHDF